MFGILVKKQMAEIFRGYFYDAKKNKKRSKISTILFMLMYVILMVGVVGGVFTFLAVQLCKPFSLVDMSWLYFLIMGMIAIAFVHHFAATIVACRTSAIVVNLLNEFLGMCIRNVLYLYSCTANINN